MAHSLEERIAHLELIVQSQGEMLTALDIFARQTSAAIIETNKKQLELLGLIEWNI